MYAQYTGHKNTIKMKAYSKINSCTAMLNVNKIIATPINSNKFTEFAMKKLKF